jgi:hypothetical protein
MKRGFLIFGVLMLILSACTESNKEETSGTTRFNLYLTDAPGKYEEVLIDIQEVRAHVTAHDSSHHDSGWMDLEVNAGVYDLLDFANDMDTLLASADLPAGKISQIRLILGENNEVKVDGEYHDLKTPSGQQSGIKLNVHEVLEEGITYELWIDFDACKSIVKTGNGKYILKPVIKTYTRETSGAIKGVVVPAASRPFIFTVSASHDTISTIADSLTGKFMLKGLPAGEYDVEFEPVEGFDDEEIEDVNVTLGVVTNLGTVVIEQDDDR